MRRHREFCCWDVSGGCVGGGVCRRERDDGDGEEWRGHDFDEDDEPEEVREERLLAGSLAEKFTGGSLTPLITHLVDQKRIAPEEIERLRNILNAAGEKGASE